MVEAIERGFPQREIQESSYRFARALETKQKVIVGVNHLVTEEEPPIDVLVIGDDAHRRQCAKLEKLRSERDGARVRATLGTLIEAARADDNLLPRILDCVRAYATLGEMCDALRSVFGEYREPLFD
jgi:methylmalonyl-CoA mutase N-terminal domain/subunit